MKYAFCIVAAVLLPIEGRAEHRLIFIPSLEFKEVSDDNLNFAAVDPLRDRVRRLTPGLVLQLDSPRWSLRSMYSLDSEQFMNYSAFNDNRARERAGVSLQYRAGPRLTVSLDSAYFATNTLTDLNADTGLAASRVRGRRVDVSPSGRFRISSTQTLTASARSVTTSVVNGTGMRSQEQSLGFEQRITPTTGLTVDYAHSHIMFEGQISQLVSIHSLLAGWAHDLGVHDRLIVQIGPCVTNGSRLLEGSASLTHRWKRSFITLSLSQAQTTAIGSLGVVNARSAQAKWSLTPTPKLTAYAAPAIVRSSRGSLSGTVFRAAAGASYAFIPSLSADIAYSHDAQNGSIDAVLPTARFSRSVVSIGFTTQWNDRDQMR